MSKAAPRPLIRRRAQTTLYRIAVDIAHLLHELSVIPNIQVEVALLPKSAFASNTRSDSLRIGEFKPVQCFRQAIYTRLAQQEANVLRHDNESVDRQLELHTHLLKRFEEQVTHRGVDQFGKPKVTTECHEMRLPRLMESFETASHRPRVRAHPGK